MTKPGVCVIVAGFQNIEDNAPPAATPANASPCPTVLCSRKPNAPAFASIAAIGMRTAALASNAAQPDLTVFAPMIALPPGVASRATRLRLRRDLPTSVLLLGAKPAVTAMASH